MSGVSVSDTDAPAMRPASRTVCPHGLTACPRGVWLGLLVVRERA